MSSKSFLEYMSRAGIGLTIASLLLISTELGLVGSIAVLVGTTSAFMFSRSIQDFVISTLLSLAIYSVIILVIIFVTDEALGTSFCLAVFSLVFVLVVATLRKLDAFDSPLSRKSEFISVLPVVVVISWFSYMISRIEDTSAARLSWLGFIGEDNAAWVGAFSYLSPLRSGGVTIENTGGGGPFFVPIGAIVDGLQSLSGLNLKADISPLSVINLYAITFTLGVLAASILAVTLARIIVVKSDTLLEFCVASLASVSSYLMLATMAKVGHLATIMAVSATFAVLLLLLNLDNSSLQSVQKLVLSLIGLSLLPGFWYPLAFVVFFFTLFLGVDAVKRYRESRENLLEILLLFTLLIIVVPILAGTLFSTGDVNPLRYLTFEGGVIQLSALASIFMVITIFFALSFAQERLRISMYWSNLIVAITLNLSLLWFLSYVLPFANGPKYAVYKLSLVTMASLIPISIALLMVYVRGKNKQARVFATLSLLITFVIGSITPEVANYKFGFNSAEYRWAKPLINLVNDSPNQQILCLAGFDGYESYLCTRFAAVLTGDAGNLTVAWRAASIDLLPEDLWGTDLISIYNEKLSQDPEDIHVLLIDIERDVRARYPWFEKLLVE
jgi:hypothetical protein